MMNDKLMKKLEKKGKKLNPIEKEAKMSVVKELGDQAREMMGEKVKGLKALGDEVGKPHVPGRNPDEVVEKAEEEMGKDLDKDEEEGESEEHKEKVLGEEKEDEECSPEELDEKIKKLMELKKQKLADKE